MSFPQCDAKNNNSLKEERMKKFQSPEQNFWTTTYYEPSTNQNPGTWKLKSFGAWNFREVCGLEEKKTNMSVAGRKEKKRKVEGGVENVMLQEMTYKPF